MLDQQSVKTNTPNRKLKNWAVAIVGLAVYLAVGIWGGVPPQSSLGLFLGGLVVLLLVVAVLGLVGWHLLFRPLPADTQAAETTAVPVTIRSLLATIFAVSGLFFIVGGFWDEVWHRLYGVPFGEDFFWRPHLMLYAGFLAIIGLSSFGLWYVVRTGQGTLQQRFRANPAISLIVFAGAFMMYALPADPIWHYMYGDDIAAWSIPHFNILLCFSSVLVLALIIHMTTQPVRQWDMHPRAVWRDRLPLLTAALMLNTLVQGMTTDWEGASLQVLQARPDWLLPATIVVIATLTGAMVSHATRFIGAATLTGLLALGIRLFLRWGFDFYAVTANAWVLAVFPLVAMDVVCFVHLLWRKRPPAWPVTGLAAAVGMAAALPLLNQYFRYPQFGADNLLMTLFATSIAACGAVWVGQRLGDYAATANKQGQDVPEAAESTLRYVPAAAFVAVIGFIVFFVATATPPA